MNAIWCFFFVALDFAIIKLLLLLSRMVVCYGKTLSSKFILLFQKWNSLNKSLRQEEKIGRTQHSTKKSLYGRSNLFLCVILFLCVVASLGNRICQKSKSFEFFLSTVPCPTFQGSFADWNLNNKLCTLYTVSMCLV